MKNILFPTAHSRFSSNIWMYALKLAQHFGARITLMHVFEDATVSLLPGNDFLSEEMAEKLENNL